MELQDAIKLWKENKIDECVMEFSCGGDSMNDYSFVFKDDEGSEVECSELESFFDDETFKKVEFYINSDGHYQGEAGTVIITLEEEEEDFTYSKSAEAEYHETHTSILEIELPQEMANFIRNNVFNINGGEGENVVVNFKKDLILSEKDQMLLSLIEDTISEEASNYSPEDVFDLGEWYTFTTNEEGEDLIIKDNKLQIKMSNQYVMFVDSDD